MKNGLCWRPNAKQGLDNIFVSISVMNLERKIILLRYLNVALKGVVLQCQGISYVGPKIIQSGFANCSHTWLFCQFRDFVDRRIE